MPTLHLPESELRRLVEALRQDAWHTVYDFREQDAVLHIWATKAKAELRRALALLERAEQHEQLLAKEE